MKNYDCIIIGSGIAAMQLAKHLCPKFQVLVITKSKRTASNSYRAQGGIAAAVGTEDHPSFHYQDTIQAGCSFHDERAVWELVDNGPEMIEELTSQGLNFDKEHTGELSLGMEGAHSQKRILHCGGDATGKHIMDHLFSSIQPNIDIMEDEFVYELIIHPVTKKCIGVKSKGREGNNYTYFGSNIVVAVGGVGGLFSFTSNDASVAGDGIALAYRAGADIVDMEFIQFHPTLLYVDGKTRGLISEAVRGEGGRLIDASGRALMDDKHPLGDLAPRHVVAKEIYKERTAGNEVFLDITMITDFNSKFPTVSKLCEMAGVSLAKGKIPVAPGCHFLMGGIAVNQVGETSINGLFAIGETAATGVHGANRLASNSLLEGLYFGKKLADYLNGQGSVQSHLVDLKTEVPQSKKLLLPSKGEIQLHMMSQAGIIRTEEELVYLKKWLSQFDTVSDSLDLYSREEIQVLLMLQVAKLVTNVALMREESRGAHIREDFPLEDARWKEVHIVQSIQGIEKRRQTNERHQVEVHT